jgi:DNA-binding beta-propeller fold protein YncE
VVLSSALWLLVLASCVVPAAGRAAGSVYVSNVNGLAAGTVSQYAVGVGGLLSSVTPPTVSAGADPFPIAVTPDGKSAYVANAFDNTVSQYDINPASGALSPKTPATVATGTFPEGLAVTPDSKSVYVTNVGRDTVSQYSVDPQTGALSPKTPATVGTGPAPFGVAVSPDGKSAYVADSASVGGGVSQYSIDPLTGALSPKTPGTVAAGVSPTGIAVTPNGKSVYAANQPGNGGGTVSQFDVGAGGALTPKTPAAVPAGFEPEGLAVSPDGRSAYAANVLGDTISQYSIDPVNGTLSPKTPATVATGVDPVAIAVTPDGGSAYVPNLDPHDFSNGIETGNVSQYTIDPVTGSLSPKTPATVLTVTRPMGIAIGPLPRALTTATSVSCLPQRFAPGDATVCKATVTDRARGQSPPTGTVTFASIGPGSFYGSPCKLSGSGASASCAVFFSSFPRGGRVITASYSGDGTHDPSTGATSVAVAPPASTDGCLVFGHGRITAANGDRASFSGLAVAAPPRGTELYRDNGPADPFRLASTTVDAVTCSRDASRASVFGAARLNSARSVEYRIDIQLAAWERGKDTYRIRLSSGYDTALQPIRHGDLHIRLHSTDRDHLDANANHSRGGQQDGG